MSKLWQKSRGATQSETAKKVEAFTVGNDYKLDQVLVPYDLAASAVHAEALKNAGILADEEFQQLTEALEDILKSWKKQEFEIRVEDEDMHTAIERTLTEKLGELGKKIHAGRSRNDQVLTAVRLYEKEQIEKVLEKTVLLAGQLIEFGQTYSELPFPGFTHTRKAMLSSVALWAGGFAEMLIMQLRASGGIRSLVNRNPLGSAAGFGTTFPIDRDMETEKLNFEKPLVCATTAQLSRGWVELQIVQFLGAISIVLNRLSADVIQYSSEAYSFFELHPDVCTGSSIMPQKKNPDLAELIRGRHSSLLGHASTLQSVVVNLTSGYHRDLQLTKEPVIQSFNSITEMLDAISILISAIRPNNQAIKDACTQELFAAERANQLVKNKGYSFREAYLEIKNNTGEEIDITLSEMMNMYSHLGSPGNPGLDRLADELRDFS